MCYDKYMLGRVFVSHICVCIPIIILKKFFLIFFQILLNNLLMSSYKIN